MFDWDSLTTVISSVSNNTLIGTLLAGLILGWVALRQYRQHKSTDIEFEFIRKRREFAADLFSKIDLAMKHYDAQVTIYTGVNPQLQFLHNQINQKHDDYFKKESDKNFNAFTGDISKSADNLISALKLDNNYSEEKTAVINTNVAMFNVMLLLGSFFDKLKREDIEKQQTEIRKVATSITRSLQEIISGN